MDVTTPNTLTNCSVAPSQFNTVSATNLQANFKMDAAVIVMSLFNVFIVSSNLSTGTRQLHQMFVTCEIKFQSHFQLQSCYSRRCLLPYNCNSSEYSHQLLKHLIEKKRYVSFPKTRHINVLFTI